MGDLRSPQSTGSLARGVFSAYHDLNFTNADSSSQERLQLQWSDYYRIDFSTLVFGGSVTFRWGDKTASVTPVIGTSSGAIDPTGTLPSVQAAMNSLFGASNVRVQLSDPFTPGSPASNPSYEVHFRGSLARQDISPNLLIETNNLLSGGSGSSITLTGVPSLDTELDVVTRGALNHNIDNGTIVVATIPSPIVRYTNGPAGSLLNSTGATRTINRLGGFVNVTSPQAAEIARVNWGLSMLHL